MGNQKKPSLPIQSCMLGGIKTPDERRSGTWLQSRIPTRVSGRSHISRPYASSLAVRWDRDIPFKLSDTEWTSDFALKVPSEGLLVAERRRTVSAVWQEEVATFIYKIELLPLQVPGVLHGIIRVPQSCFVGGNGRPQEADFTDFRLALKMERRSTQWVTFVSS